MSSIETAYGSPFLKNEDRKAVISERIKNALRKFKCAVFFLRACSEETGPVQNGTRSIPKKRPGPINILTNFEH